MGRSHALTLVSRVSSPGPQMAAQDLTGLLSSLPSPCPAAGRVATCQGSRPCKGKRLGLPASCCSALRAGGCLFCFGGARLTLAASCSSQDVGLTLESASLVIQSAAARTDREGVRARPQGCWLALFVPILLCGQLGTQKPGSLWGLEGLSSPLWALQTFALPSTLFDKRRSNPQSYFPQSF